MTNTTPGRSIDPRFDPAFQPGYDPQSDPARAARVPSFDAAIDSPRQQPGRVVEPPRAEPPRVMPFADAPPSRGADAERTPSTAEQLPEPTGGLRVNPFLVALWGVGIVLVGLGAYLTQQLLDPTSEFVTATITGASTTFYSGQVAIYGAPFLTATGVIAMCIALAVHALRWNRR